MEFPVVPSEIPFHLDKDLVFNFEGQKPQVSASDYDLADPTVLADLLLTSSAITFVEEKVNVCTLDFITQQADEVFLKVISALGLKHLIVPTNILIDLLWWLSIGHHPIIRKPETLEYISRFNPDSPEFLQLFDEESRLSLEYGAQKLYATLTGVFIDISEIMEYFNPEKFPQVLRWNRVVAIKMGFYLSEGPPLDQGHHFNEYPPFLRGLTSDDFGPLEPIVERYQITYPSVFLPYLLMFPPGVDLIITGYTPPQDNIEELSSFIGMAFPPHITTDLQKTDYFFRHLHEYHGPDNFFEGTKGLAESGLTLDNLDLNDLMITRDEVLIEHFGAPVGGWEGHRDLVDKIDAARDQSRVGVTGKFGRG